MIFRMDVARAWSVILLLGAFGGWVISSVAKDGQPLHGWHMPSVAQLPIQDGTQATGVARWIEARAEPLPLEQAGRFGNIQAFKNIVGSARIVSFGEGGDDHGTPESLALRNQLFKYLVEELDFNVIAAETSFREAIATDDYVLGREVDAHEAASAVFSFPGLEWPENRVLVDWMRAYNARPSTKRPLRFYGLDIYDGKERPGGDGALSVVRRSVNGVLGYVDSVDPGEAQQFRGRFEPALVRLDVEGYDALTSKEQDSLTLGIADLSSSFERRHVEWVSRTSSEAYHRAHRQVLNLRHLDADFRSRYWRPENPTQRGDQRDVAMADNLRWILEREGPNARVLVFVHTWHAKKGRQTNPVLGRYTSAGEYLDEMLGRNMVVIGSFHGTDMPLRGDSGVPALGGTLMQVSMPSFVIDLRAMGAESPVAQWWNRDMLLRGTRVVNPIEAFDAMVFMKDVSPAHPFE